MSDKRQLEFNTFAGTHPVFTLEELAMARGRPQDLAAARNQLKHHIRRGRIKSIARGIHATVPPGACSRDWQPDPMDVAAAARPDGVFSYHSAFELLGFGYSAWNVVTLHCSRRRSPISVGSTELLFLPTPTRIRRAQAEGLGLQEAERSGRQIRFSGPERSLVEGFQRPDRMGGLLELAECASAIAVLDFELLERVLETYDERSTWAAVGWFAALHRDRWLPPESFLQRCEKQRPRSNQFLVRDERGGRLLSRWNLIVPENLLSGFEGHASIKESVTRRGPEGRE